MNRYTQLNENERSLINYLFNIERISISKIALKLKRNKSTISREIKRNTVDDIYSFDSAHKKHKDRQWHKHMFYLEKYSILLNVFQNDLIKNFME